MPHNELNKRLDNEAFGPKTDFSIWNFENNFDKLNNEEQSMMIYKMQREFNNPGYTDYNGKELKTDGILGKKTKSAYEKYKWDNIREPHHSRSYDSVHTNLQDDNKYKYTKTGLKPANDNPKLYNYNNLTDESDTKKQNIGSNVDRYSYSIVMNSADKPLHFASVEKNPGKVTYQKSKPQMLSPTDIVHDNPENAEIIKKYGLTREDDTFNEVRSKIANVVIEDNSDFIVKAAQEFEVNPGILGAVIYAEQSQNVNSLDYYFDNIGGQIGIDTSIGIGQIKLSTAKMLEDKGYMPKISSDKGGKTERQKRIEALENPETNIKYAAAYLKYFQDRWESVYPEIDGKTDILASLYNLGHEKTSPHSKPTPNEFGIVAKSYYHIVRKILNIE